MIDDPLIPKIGHYYVRYEGTIRRIESVDHKAFGIYVMGVSRRPTDPPQKWPGSWGAYLPTFWANTIGEISQEAVYEPQFDAAYGPWLLAQHDEEYTHD